MHDLVEPVEYKRVLPTYQNSADKRDFQSSRDDVEHHGRQQEADTLGSAVDCSRQSTRLAAEMEVQVESEEVLEDIPRDAANRLLCDTSKNRISQLLKEGGADSRRAVWNKSVRPRDRVQIALSYRL